MNDPLLEHDADPALPCAGGLLSGTLALMTCWAAPAPEAKLGAAQQRALMARKIASNLFFLREHPDLPVGLRMVVTKLHARWCEIAGGRSPMGAPPAECCPGAALH